MWKEPVMINRLKSKLRPFKKNEKGVAALEFAIILPLMMSMWLGTFEITQSIAASRRVTLVSRTIADLTSRADKVNATDISTIFGASKAVFSPLDSTQLKMILTSVKRTGGQDRVVWSKVPSGQSTPGPYAAGTTFTLPNNILAAENESVIVAEVTYPYQPISQWITMPVAIDLGQKTYMIPRVKTEVTFY